MGSVSPLRNVQYAALPWRLRNGRAEILLVTTLTTRRWIVPKGWPVAGMSPDESAADEALEEAGVIGDVQPQPFGTYHYGKRRKTGEIVPLKVLVFLLEVTHRRREWPEKGARETMWCSLEEALSRVGEPGLRRIVAKFARQNGMQSSSRTRVAATAEGLRVAHRR